MKVFELYLELVEQLGKGNGELEVITEGCDCWGGIEKVSIDSNKVCLRRTDLNPYFEPEQGN